MTFRPGMPVPRGAIREVAVVLASAAALAVSIASAWHMTHSKAHTVLAGGCFGILLYLLDRQRALRRRQLMLPVHVRYPGSTAL